MANKTIEDLRAQIAASEDVEESAELFIKGTSARIKAAVEASIQNGATAEELAPLTEEIANLKKHATALAEAITENT